MTQILFNTYEVIREIGSGGGGVVYLARHLRLGKLVVLKADKRTLKAKPESLRREVDALKNLSHTYIPQVYDFFVEDSTVYTVMDYIEGESLDKPLKRGERFSQADVIMWADQLLQAVVYLHSRPPHGILHSDIKPANVMLTPQGDICLIDFNIALALGEEGAVRVGFSRGYASPEHYGIDYSAAAATDFGISVSTKLPETQVETAVLGQNPFRSGQGISSGSGSSSNRGVLLDVRSDIYSLGATLYHLLTGERPDPDAKKVKPISGFDVSLAVAKIICRAMEPDPNDRYQTAKEMLEELRALHRNDPRAVRHRHCVKVTAAVLIGVFLIGGGMTFTGLRGMQKAEEEARRAEEAARLEAQRAEEEEREKREREEAARAALADITSSEDALRRGDIPAARALALEALDYDSPYKARAQKALTDAMGIYDLSDGFKSRLCVELAAEPVKLSLSPDGAYFGVTADGNAIVYETDAGERILELDTDRSALSDICFAGGGLLVYAGDGALTACDIKTGSVLWTAAPATNITVNDNAVAAVYHDEATAYVYDLTTGAVLRTVKLPGALQRIPENDIFADPENDLFVLDDTSSHLAVSVSGGGLQILDLADPDNSIIIFEDTEYTHFEGGFYGKYLAFSATGGGKSVFAVIDTEEVRQTGGFSSTSPFHVQADSSGIYLSLEDVLVKLDPESGEQTEVAYTDKDITAFKKCGDYTIVATEDEKFSVFGPEARLMSTWDGRASLVGLAGGFAAVAGIDGTSVRILQLEARDDADLFSYDPGYLHSEARLSADGRTVTMFRYDRLRVCAMDGTVLADVELPDADKIYDQQFRRTDGDSRLEVTWYDGTVRSYSARDGALLEESHIDPPDTSLHVEYTTDKFRVEAPMNGSPTVYDRKTGEMVGQLQSDDFLTYIYDSAGYTVAEFMTGNGRRYGVLLTDELEPLAELPNLCDVFPDGTLIFDDNLGTLRQSRVYSIQELIALANLKEE